MAATARESEVLRAVVSLVDSLLGDFDVVDLLTELTERCAQLLDVESAGLLLADPVGQLHLIAATSQQTEHLELFQLQDANGPCLDCYHSGEVVSVADVRQCADRWPGFVAAAAWNGFSSVHAVPLRAGSTVLGALGLFGSSVGALNPADLLVGQTLAHIATVALVQEHAPSAAAVLPRLWDALTGRVVVEQAKGFVADRLGISIAEAFARLRHYAQTRKHHLTKVASSVVSDHAVRDEVMAELTKMSAAPGRDTAPAPRSGQA